MDEIRLPTFNGNGLLASASHSRGQYQVCSTLGTAQTVRQLKYNRDVFLGS